MMQQWSCLLNNNDAAMIQMQQATMILTQQWSVTLMDQWSWSVPCFHSKIITFCRKSTTAQRNLSIFLEKMTTAQRKSSIFIEKRYQKSMKNTYSAFISISFENAYIWEFRWKFDIYSIFCYISCIGNVWQRFLFEGCLQDLTSFGKLECMGDQFVRVFSRKVYLCNT